MVVRPPRYAAAVFLVLALPFLATAAGAGEDDLFTVTGVEVDATASNAAAAREVALAEGQARALDILLRRLTLRRDHPRLPVPPEQRLAELVKAIEIADERTSAVRYLAGLTVRFNAEQVRLFLRLENVRFAETVRRPELVLPVYQVAGALLLWDEPNPWKLAWAAGSASGYLAPLILPIGDLSDMSDIGAAQARRGDAAALAAIARRYSAGSVLVVIANLTLDTGSGLPVLDVAARRYGADSAARTVFEGRFDTMGTRIDAVLADAVAVVTEDVEEAWKLENLLRLDLQGRVHVTVPVGGIEEWVEVRRRLGRVAAIRRTELMALTRGQVWLALDYVGELRQLALALAQQDMDLRQGLAAWTLRLARPAPRQAATPVAQSRPAADETAEATGRGAGQQPGPLPDRRLFQNSQ